MKIGKLLIFSAMALSLHSYADAKLAGRACRSIHLQYPTPPCEKVEIEVVPEESHDGTYFCALGFNMGYFGFQQLYDNKKVVIFSIWDPGHQNDPNIVPEDKRAKVIYHDQKVKTDRFGNEGTGAKTFYDYDWKIGEKLKFRVESAVEGKITTFTAHFYQPEVKKWIKLASIQTKTGGKKLSSIYSFVEDFRRNRVSATKRRAAKFGNLKVEIAGKTTEIKKARFTGDSNPAINVNAGQKDGLFFLETGGKVENKDTKLWQSIELK